MVAILRRVLHPRSFLPRSMTLTTTAHTPSALSAGPGITITDVLELPRPQSGVPNPSGTLALWGSSSFSFASSRTERSISLIDIPSAASDAATAGEPRKVLTGLAQLEFCWLDERTFLFVRPSFKARTADALDHPEGVSDEDQSKRLKELTGDGVEVWAKDVLEGDEYLVGVLPTACGFHFAFECWEWESALMVGDDSVANLKVAPNHEPRSNTNEPAAILAFSATVFPDGDPYKVAANESKAKEAARGSVRVVTPPCTSY